jgi:hypothetical protein
LTPVTRKGHVHHEHREDLYVSGHRHAHLWLESARGELSFDPNELKTMLKSDL